MKRFQDRFRRGRPFYFAALRCKFIVSRVANSAFAASPGRNFTMIHSRNLSLKRFAPQGSLFWARSLQVAGRHPSPSINHPCATMCHPGQKGFTSLPLSSPNFGDDVSPSENSSLHEHRRLRVPIEFLESSHLSLIARTSKLHRDC